MKTIHAVLLIPEEGDPHGLLKEGPCYHVRMICSAANCTKKAVAKGLCSGHYQRMRRGEASDAPLGRLPLGPHPRRKTKAAYFADHHRKDGPTQPHMTTPCWPWTAQVHTRDGYGVARTKTFRARAHRLAWEVLRGPIPAGQHVLHHCDFKACVNPDHLYLGDDASNSADAWARGRKLPVQGEQQGSSKLKAADVYAIRNRGDHGESHVSIAADFPVGPSAIRRIVNRQRWTHLPEAPDA